MKTLQGKKSKYSAEESFFSARSSGYSGFRNLCASHFIQLPGETISKNVFKEAWTPGYKADKDVLWFSVQMPGKIFCGWYF